MPATPDIVAPLLAAVVPLLAGLHLPAPVWWFYALGPQLVLCLWLGYLTARRRGAFPAAWRRATRSDWRRLIDWLTGAFLASLFPVAGVLLLLWLWWRSPQAPGRPAPVSGDGAGGPGP